MSHVVHCGVTGLRNINAQFFMLGWDRYGFHKKYDGTRYIKLVFLHPMESAGHVVHSGASGARNVDAHFMLGWPWCGSIKSALGHITPNFFSPSDGICGSRSAF
jgi:hypothetical protein